ncbi:MAG: glycoside hydrolase family 43 protein [Rhizobiaceae bacterium]|nr:glycoside hydrolase family 43 protein [Rhizobiaceae bacterium]
MIRNPILPGFNPDPSIWRVGSDYYIATSTFEWYPGVQIHHSKDLVNWTLVSRPLRRKSQLDMRGNPDSCGIWAPCLSHADGKFWLVYTDVKRYDGNFKDTHNFIVTCDTIDGEWSDPIYVNSSGFDPSLYHGEDGRKWFLNMQLRHTRDGDSGKPLPLSFDGILMQEYDSEQGKLIGPKRNIFAGSSQGLVEGPHLFKRNDYYYLTTAEGGTSYNHVVTMARSRDIWGPYEIHPNIHLLTSKDAPDAPVQRAGHGQIVETPDGEPYHTHLMSRPLPNKRSPLGRETGIQKCVWRDDGWLYMEQGGLVPVTDVPSPDPAIEPDAPKAVYTKFDGNTLPEDFQWLRTPEPDDLFNLTGKTLRLIGRESIGSWFSQSLVARRQEHFKFRAETKVVFEPETYQHAAGLTLYYNRFKFHFLAFSHSEELGRVVSIMSCEADYPGGNLTFALEQSVPISGNTVEMRADVDHQVLQYFYRIEANDEWIAIGPELDASLISDEAGRGAHGSFTGAFIGMLAFDITGQQLTADFDHFNYIPE